MYQPHSTLSLSLAAGCVTISLAVPNLRYRSGLRSRRVPKIRNRYVHPACRAPPPPPERSSNASADVNSSTQFHGGVKAPAGGRRGATSLSIVKLCPDSLRPWGQYGRRKLPSSNLFYIYPGGPPPLDTPTTGSPLHPSHSFPTAARWFVKMALLPLWWLETRRNVSRSCNGEI